MAWLVTGLLLLLAALALGLGGLLLMLYLRGAFRRRVQYKMNDAPKVDDDRFPHLLEGLSGSLDSPANVTGFWVEADAIFRARWEAIRAARHTVQFETFYMTPGRRADEFAIELLDAARRGCKVQVLVDEYGSKDIADAYWRRLCDGGVDLRFFRKLDWRSPLDYLARTHRKLLLIDGDVALVGGAGISDDWDGKAEIGDTAPWRDFEIRFEGHLVGTLAGIFMQDWSAEDGPLDLSDDIFRSARKGGDTMTFVTTGSYSMESSSLRMLFQISILAARQRVWIASPYFLPEPSTREALLEACRQGVDVRVLTMGPHNDRPYVYRAARESYGELIDGGVRLFEYQPSMMHAKALLVDDRWLSTGSANFDPLSFFHNNELNISHCDREFVHHLDAFFEESFARACEITPAMWRARPWQDKLVGKSLVAFRRVF